MSARLAVMREDEIEYVGPQQDVDDQPQITYVAGYRYEGRLVTMV